VQKSVSLGRPNGMKFENKSLHAIQNKSDGCMLLTCLQSNEHGFTNSVALVRE
jgi:hypothetical protein